MQYTVKTDGRKLADFPTERRALLYAGKQDTGKITIHIYDDTGDEIEMITMLKEQK